MREKPPAVSIIDWQSGDAIDIDSWNRYWGISNKRRIVSEVNIAKQKEHAAPNVQLTSALAGYADYAGAFDWERTIRMNREVVQDIVNHLRTGRGEPVAAYLPPKSVELLAENSPRPESIVDLSDFGRARLQPETGLAVEKVHDKSPEKNAIIKIPTKFKAKKQTTKPFFEIVVNDDGNKTFIFRR